MAPPDEIRSPAGGGCALETILEEPPRDNPHPAAAQRPRMVLAEFKPVIKGSLRGFATVKLPSGLTIADCPVLTSHGKSWASLPSKPLLVDGRQVEVDGKKKYLPILAWPDRATADRWSDAVVMLVRQQHPGALDEGGAG